MSPHEEGGEIAICKTNKKGGRKTAEILCYVAMKRPLCCVLCRCVFAVELHETQEVRRIWSHSKVALSVWSPSKVALFVWSHSHVALFVLCRFIFYIHIELHERQGVRRIWSPSKVALFVLCRFIFDIALHERQGVRRIWSHSHVALFVLCGFIFDIELHKNDSQHAALICSHSQRWELNTVLHSHERPLYCVLCKNTQ